MYDLAVIGAGWAGFNAVITAKELGLKVCLIEASQIGGTCLNRGCIPTKALIQSAKALALSKKSQVFGLEPVTPQVNFLKVQQRKDKIVQQLQQGMRSLLSGIDFLNAKAEILSNTELKVGSNVINARYLLIAAGSRPIELPAFKFDSKRIISSDDLLSINEIPKSFLIIGGGVIGCEFASLFSAMGTHVTIAEKMPQLLPGEDKEVARKLELIFKKKGIKVNTNTDAATLDLNAFDLILVCVGRMPNTEGMNLDKIGVKLDRSKIVVDDYLKTSIPNIYAAGDCTGKILLAHYAAYQGRIAVNNLAKPDSAVKADNTCVPGCIFTEPEIASVGLSEESAGNKGLDIKVKRFDFAGSGMARILDETEGFIKIVADAKTEELLGASIIGPKATELIGILTLAVTHRLKIPQIRETIFAHPTLSECIIDALKTGHAV